MDIISKHTMNPFQLRWYRPTPLAHGLNRHDEQLDTSSPLDGDQRDITTNAASNVLLQTAHAMAFANPSTGTDHV